MTPPPRPIADDPVAIVRYNRTCRLIALLWLGVLLPVSFALKHAHQDFGQFYMGGRMAWLGEWTSLYPAPKAGSAFNAGFRDGSTQQPGYARVAQLAGVGNVNRFILPPPDAILFAPMGALPYGAAHWLWIVVMTFFTWRVSAQAGRVFELARGSPSRHAGQVTLLVAASVLAFHSVREGNLSPMVAWCFGAVVLRLVEAPTTRGAWACGAAVCLGTVTKVAALVVLPVLALRRRWGAIAVTALLIAIVLAVSVRVAGWTTFTHYVRVIAPTLARCTPHPPNQCLLAAILRATGRPSAPPRLLVAWDVIRYAALAALLLFLWSRRAAFAGRAASTPLIAAATAALVAWLLIFGPLCWEHYCFYFAPLWGWLAWEADQGLPRRLAAFGAIALHFLPPHVFVGGHLPEPVNSYMLLGTMTIAALAVARLAATAVPAAPATPIDDSLYHPQCDALPVS